MDIVQQYVSGDDMQEKKTAIVIGAEIGGIASAARLAAAATRSSFWRRTVNPADGQASWRRDGHRFDLGPTLFLMPEVWEETYAALGEKMSEHLDLRRIDPTYTVHFEDGLEAASDIQPRRNAAATRRVLRRTRLPAFSATSRKPAGTTRFRWRSSLAATSTACLTTSVHAICRC